MPTFSSIKPELDAFPVRATALLDCVLFRRCECPGIGERATRIPLFLLSFMTLDEAFVTRLDARAAEFGAMLAVLSVTKRCSSGSARSLHTGNNGSAWFGKCVVIWTLPES